MKERLILASGSPRRAKILADLERGFDVVKTDAPEVSYDDDPERTVRENALAKGAAAGGRRVLSADTIVWFNGRIYGKPRDIDEAKRFLRELSGNVHSVYTAVAFDGDVKVVRSDVKFRVLSEEMIEEYVAKVRPLDRAGAYDIDESGDLIVESWTGSYENIMGLPLEPLRAWGLGYIERSFPVRSYEAGVDNNLSLSSLCNYLQEIAGLHADKLGVGIHLLQSEGVTWMLSRLRLEIAKPLAWGEDLSIRTWPSGTRGRLTATRDFIGGNSAGEEVFRAVSEWMTVNLAARRLVKLPENFSSLAPEGTPHVELAESGGKFAALGAVHGRSLIKVRFSDHDFNDHVNNVHYVEWALESIPDEYRHRLVTRLDIVFRQEAKAGDELESLCEIVDDGLLRHTITRLSDGALLATAETGWSGK
jgi:MAF protein